MPYLFLFHIGPVQTFIASARSTRDLWFGSQLLSDLSWTAARAIANDYGSDSLIFPFFSVEESVSPVSATARNVANKIVARLESGDSTQGGIVPQDVANKVKCAVDDRLIAIKEDLYDRLNTANFDKSMMDQQIQDLVEFFWVAISYSDTGEEDYHWARRRVESLMAARKATANYQAVTWGGALYKSSITGTLESVIPRDDYPRRSHDKSVQSKKVTELYEAFRAGPAEHLSGVDLLKRRGRFPATKDQQAYFLSTSHIAAQPFLTGLASVEPGMQKKLRESWQTYFEHLSKDLPTLSHEHIPFGLGYQTDTIIGSSDGALLFPEHLREHAADNKDVLLKAQTLLDTFLKFVQPRLEPSPYYAIVLADGDNMGVTIDALALEGHSRHQEFSRYLSAFADDAKAIVLEHQGTPIYAGGDDVLALVPLHRLLACADELEKSFAKRLESFERNGTAPTLSMGIAIVHHLSLLQEALEVARAAEKVAKAVPGKHALAITLNKRGGEPSTIAGPIVELRPILLQLMSYYHDSVIPAGLSYELRDLNQRLTPIDEKLPEAMKSVIWSDARHVLQRKLNLPSSKVRQTGSEPDEADRQASVILSTLLSRIEGRPVELLPTIVPIAEQIQAVPLTELVNELIIARELSMSQVLAEGPLPIVVSQP